MKRPVRIKHLSHGIAATGGFMHEQFFMEQLAAFMEASGTPVITESVRANRFFKGLSQLRMMVSGFFRADSDVNIVVVRYALPAIIRNLFSKRINLVVLHYFDEKDGKGLLLKYYNACLFMMLRSLRLRHTAIIAVAPFWVDYFSNKVKHNVPVFCVPNFFDTKAYTKYRTAKQKQVHLGQYSFKNDPRIFELAAKLNQQGFSCYFSTMIAAEAGRFENYEIRYEPFETYLTGMASSAYTLAYIGISEGWNRVAHESILVGTPVIGVDKGGLGDLLHESGSLIAKDTDTFCHLVTEGAQPQIKESFISKYDRANAAEWIRPVAGFVRQARASS